MTTQPEQIERGDFPPREELLRMAPFRLRADTGDDTDGLTLDGWAAVFNREAIIDSWEGRFWEKLSPGSMKKSFRTVPPKMQFDHGTHPVFGSLPIARVESVREETHPEFAPEGGAHVIARLHDNWMTEPVRDAMDSGAVDGMSFRMTILREQWSTPDGKPIHDPDELYRMLRETVDAGDDELLHRNLREVRVPELGPVVWPAYEDTSVSVRSLTIDLGRITERSQRLNLWRAMAAADAAERKINLNLADESVQSRDGHPDDVDGNTRQEDAQSRDGHPSDADDAQSRDGHPSDHLSDESAALLHEDIKALIGIAATITKGN